MSRRRHEEAEEGGAWEIALADLMTVMMVFFLVMWLISIVDPAKRKDFVSAITGDTDGDDIVEMEAGATAEILERPSQIEEPVTVEDVQEALKSVDSKDVDINETEDQVIITLRSDGFFESARATIKDSTREELEKLAETFAGGDQNISITGHTDSVPISNFQFPSNWELSSARAATIARVFVDMDVKGGLLTIIGKADNMSVADNKTAYGRSLNRRVIIAIDKKTNKQIEEESAAPSVAPRARQPVNVLAPPPQQQYAPRPVAQPRQYAPRPAPQQYAPRPVAQPRQYAPRPAPQQYALRPVAQPRQYAPRPAPQPRQYAPAPR